MEKAPRNIVYRPLQYFLWVFLLSWLPWSMAAYYSYMPDQTVITLILAVMGLLGPAIAAVILFLQPNNLTLRQGCQQRLFNISNITISRFLFIPTLMIVVLLAAIWLSMYFGYSSTQFGLSPRFLIMVPFAFIAATFEELGWRSYGMDSLKSKMALMPATLLFFVLWALWHVPLFFINQTYQHGLWELGGIYVANFFISMLPATILANWFYYKSKRSIPAAIWFHFVLVATAELFLINPASKCIFTLILMVVVLIMVFIDRSFFFCHRYCSKD